MADFDTDTSCIW